MLTETAITFSTMLDCHIHPILHVELCLLLLKLTLVANVMRIGGP